MWLQNFLEGTLSHLTTLTSRLYSTAYHEIITLFKFIYVFGEGKPSGGGAEREGERGSQAGSTRSAESGLEPPN